MPGRRVVDSDDEKDAGTPVSVSAAGAAAGGPAAAAARTAAKRSAARKPINFTLRTDVKNNFMRLLKDSNPAFRTTNADVVKWCKARGVRCELIKRAANDTDTDSLEYVCPRYTEANGGISYNQIIGLGDTANVAPGVSDVSINRIMSKLLYPTTKVTPFRSQLVVMEKTRGWDWRRAVAHAQKERDYDLPRDGKFHASQLAVDNDAVDVVDDSDDEDNNSKLSKSGGAAARGVLVSEETALRDQDAERVRCVSAEGKHRIVLDWAMGSGKTYGSLLPLFQNGGVSPRRLLITTTNTTLDAWGDAVQAVAPVNGGATEVLIMGETLFKAECDKMLFPIYEPSRTRVQVGDRWRYETKFKHVGGGVDALIMDEAGDYRNLRTDMLFAVHHVGFADNVILCTGTPLQNSAHDAYALLGLLGGKLEQDPGNTGRGKARNAAREPDDSEGPAFMSKLLYNGVPTRATGPSKEELMKVLRHTLVSYYNPAVHAPIDYEHNYPRIVRRRLEVELSYPQTLQYLMLGGVFTMHAPDKARTAFKHSYAVGNQFRSKQRMATNDPDVVTERSAKAVAIVDDMAGRGGERRPHDVVYSEYIESGIDLLEAEIQERALPWHCARVTGKEATNERDRLMRAFSEGKLDVLFISKAAAIGTNIMGAHRMYCMDSFPNLSAQSQTEMRVVRYKSHPPGSAVELVTVVAVFPRSAKHHTAEDAAALQEMVQHLTFGRHVHGWSDAHIRGEIDRIVQEDEQGKTVNELQEDVNQLKHKEIEACMGIITSASIQMPTGTMRAGDAAASEGRSKNHVRAFAEAICARGTGRWSCPPVPSRPSHDKPKDQESDKEREARKAYEAAKRAAGSWKRRLAEAVQSLLTDKTLRDNMRGEDWMHIPKGDVETVAHSARFLSALAAHWDAAVAAHDAAKRKRKAESAVAHKSATRGRKRSPSPASRKRSKSSHKSHKKSRTRKHSATAK